MPGGRPTKLTPAVQDAICKAVRSSSPMHWACRYAGVSDETIRNWRRTADEGLRKSSRSRSTHQRKCIGFFEAVDKAEADSFVAINTMIGAGAQKQVLVKTVTTRTPLRVERAQGGDEIVYAETTVTTTQEVGGDWRAAAHLGARRFAKDLGDRSSLDLSGTIESVHQLSNDQVWAELEHARKQLVLRAGTGDAPSSAPSANGHGAGA